MEASRKINLKKEGGEWKNLIYTSNGQKYSDIKDERSFYKSVDNIYASLNSSNSSTQNGQEPNYRPKIPRELNIFSDLPKSVFQDEDVRVFLKALEHALWYAFQESGPDNLLLSKLRISEYSESEVVLDWVFNYFQMYFTFDKGGSNYWGTVMANNQEGEFFNSVIKLRQEKSEEQAKNILDTARMLLG